MKVIQINGTSKSGSTGKIVFQLSEVMNKENIENYIISSGYKENKTTDNIYFCSSFIGVKIHQVLGILLGNAGFNSYISTYKIIKFIKKIKPDVVQLHNIYSYFLNVGVLLKFLKKSNIPVVWTIHDFWPITGHCTHFEEIGCKKWEKLCEKCPQRKSFPYSGLIDQSKTLYRKKKKIYDKWESLYIVTVSNWVKSKIKMSMLLDKPITTIYNGIDLANFKKKNIKKNSKLKDKFVILSVSMEWTPKKGYNDLLKLSEKLQNDEIIVLIGLNDKQLSELPPNIIGLKRTSNINELCDYYNIADVYVSASVEETMGLTVVEAMACGTPTIVYNKTALPELIVDGCGLISKQNVDDLYKKICEIRRHGKKYYSDKCINFTKKNFDKNIQYKKYCQLYDRILENNKLNCAVADARSNNCKKEERY